MSEAFRDTDDSKIFELYKYPYTILPAEATLPYSEEINLPLHQNLATNLPGHYPHKTY